MRDGVEAFHQIALYHPRGSGTIGPRDVSKGVYRASSWPKAIRAVTTDRFVEDFQHLRYFRLYNPVAECRDAEPTALVPSLWNVNPTHRLRCVLVEFQIVGQVLNKIWVDGAFCFAVHPWCSTANICSHTFPCLSQKSL